MKNKKKIRDLLLKGSKGKSGTLFATQREPGIYKVGDIQYNEKEFEELKKDYEDIICFTLVKNKESDEEKR